MSESSCLIPLWIKSHIFEDVLRQDNDNFQKIHSFKAYSALPPGENYATLMLKLKFEIQLKDGNLEDYTYMLKIPSNCEMMRNQLLNTFAIESQMYCQIVPEFEQLYKEAGLEITFGAQIYKLPIDEYYVLLEDLTRKGFKTCKRQLGLDMQHCRAVLKKMAQWHAASAVRMERHGLFKSLCTDGMLSDQCKDLFENIVNSFLKSSLAAVKQVPHHEEYYCKLKDLSNHLAESLRESSRIDENEFNVLNHGDCWSNNIMFQYDAENNLKETYLIDLQVPRYGTPAQDLYYFIFTSAKIELKIAHFDEMIKFYHENLIVHLKLLNYGKSLPLLRDLHQSLLKHSLWGVYSATIMAGVLFETSDLLSADNLLGDSADGQKLRSQMFVNQQYVDYLKVVLPWFHSRGAFDV